MVNEICISSALLDGAKEVFETMIFMDLEENPDQESFVKGDIVMGSITFKGEAIEGCLTICCSVDCAKAVGVNMLGLDPEAEISDGEINDAIGEVTNMVMGSVKSRLMECVGDMHVSIPMVVIGREMETRLGEGTTGRTNVKVSIDGEYPAEFAFLYKAGQ